MFALCSLLPGDGVVDYRFLSTDRLEKEVQAMALPSLTCS